MKNTIAFDFFGVICSEVAPVWFARYFPKEDIKRVKDEYIRPADTGEISTNELFATLARLTGKNTDDIAKEWFDLAVVDTQVVSEIQLLRNTFNIALLSNAPSEFIRTILTNNNLGELFSNIIISSEIHEAKPDLAFFQKALEILGSTPEEIVFFDDNPVNIQAASSLGIQSFVYKDIKSLNSIMDKNPIC